MNSFDLNRISILPPSSTRDVISLIFLFIFLPKWTNSFVFILYVLSGSTKFIGGKLFIKYFGFKTKQMDYSLYYGNSNWDHQKILTSVLQVLTINSFILLLVNYLMPNVIDDYLDILAKTVIAAELIGTSNNSITLISNNSITQSNRSHLNLQSNNSHSHSHSHSHTSNQHLNTSNNSNNHTIPNNDTDNNKNINHPLFLSNNLRIIYCFIIVLTINSVYHNINFPVVVNFLKLNDFESIFSKKVLNSYSTQNSRIRIDDLNRLNILPSQNLSLLRYLKMSKVFKMLYHELCLTVILTKFNPIFAILGFKRISNNLDQLNNLNPNIPIDFKRSKTTFKDDSIMNNDANQVPVISLKDNDNSKKLVDIPVLKSVISSKFNFNSSPSISGKNFETFVFKLFTNKRPAVNSNSIKVNKNSNSTLIIDKSFSVVQPFWSLLAVLKLVIKDSNLFQGKSSTMKNNHDNYYLTFEDPEVPSDKETDSKKELLLSIEFIDDNKILFKFLEGTLPTDLSIKLNGLKWQYFKTFNEYLLVYALSPISQYEIEITDSQLKRNILVNTISCDDVLRESVSISPIETLQCSLLSTMETLDKVKSELKEFKKDEIKRQGEVKKNNESLLDKILKINNNDEQNLKKIKGLKQSIKQFESDIQLIKEEIENATTHPDTGSEEAELLKEINEVQNFVTAYDNSLHELHNQLREVTDNKSQTSSKIEKLIGKSKDFELEIENYLSEIEHLKSTFINKIQKRLKIINDNFDTILPRIKFESLELEKANNENKQNQHLFD